MLRNLLRASFVAVAGIALVSLAEPAVAAGVNVKGLHLCCGSCVSAIESALEEVDGVTKVQVDRGGGTVSFLTKTPELVPAALTAIAKAGMYGTVLVDGKPADFPLEKVKPGTTAEKVVFHDVHLCCKACTNGVVRALEKDDTIGIVDCDQKNHTVTIGAKGKDPLDVAALQTALNKAGYHARLPVAAPAKTEPGTEKKEPEKKSGSKG